MLVSVDNGLFAPETLARLAFLQELTTAGTHHRLRKRLTVQMLHDRARRFVRLSWVQLVLELAVAKRTVDSALLVDYPW